MKKLILIFIIFSIIFTTGCWDMVEINNRIFPYSVGYDLNKNGEKKYYITITYPNINALGKNATSDKKTFLLNTHANSLFEAIRNLTTEIQQPIYLKLLKVVLLSEEVAKDEKLVRQIADGINRDFIANKNVQMLVVKESAKDLLETAVPSKKQENVEGYIYGLLLNQQSSNMFTPITLTNFIEDIDIGRVAIVPLATLGVGGIIVSGGALFKDYKLIGYLNPIENRSIAYLNNKIKTGLIETEYQGSSLSLMITNNKAKKKLISQDGNIRIKYEIRLEGHIHEFILNDDMTLDKEEVLIGMQKQAEKELKRDLEKTIEKLQKQYNADAIFISEYLNRYHPKLWKEIKDDWDQIFPDIDIEVDVNVFIRRRGLTK